MKGKYNYDSLKKSGPMLYNIVTINAFLADHIKQFENKDNIEIHFSYDFNSGIISKLGLSAEKVFHPKGILVYSYSKMKVIELHFEQRLENFYTNIFKLFLETCFCINDKGVRYEKHLRVEIKVFFFGVECDLRRFV